MQHFRNLLRVTIMICREFSQSPNMEIVVCNEGGNDVKKGHLLNVLEFADIIHSVHIPAHRKQTIEWINFTIFTADYWKNSNYCSKR